MRRPVRVMIVDDSLIVRTVLTRILEDADGFEIAAKASSAEVALTELAVTRVDVILLDLEMPGMGGLDALPKFLACGQGAQVLVVSSLTEDGAEHTLTALQMGAADTMLKPRSGGFDVPYRTALLEKIRALCPRGTTTEPKQLVAGAGSAAQRALPSQPPRLVAIGASTGGIHALCLLLRALPKQFDLPILVTQHLPESFISVFARQLETAASRKAVVAQEGMPIERGCIYVAPGGGHLMVRELGARLVCTIGRFPVASGCCPSVDPMLSSLVAACHGQAIGIILSGMGRDGSDGAASLVAAGGIILAQDEATSAVWGMPRAVVDTGLAAAVLAPAGLAQMAANYVGAAAWK